MDILAGYADELTQKTTTFEVVKRGAVVPVPDILISDSLPVLTGEERAANVAAYQRRRAEMAARREELRERLAAAAGPLGRRILALHDFDEHGECRGDELAGYEAEPPEWPCDTVRAVAEHYGIELP